MTPRPILWKKLSDNYMYYYDPMNDTMIWISSGLINRCHNNIVIYLPLLEYSNASLRSSSDGLSVRRHLDFSQHHYDCLLYDYEVLIIYLTTCIGRSLLAASNSCLFGRENSGHECFLYIITELELTHEIATTYTSSPSAHFTILAT